jgi:hypothetical protein
MAEIGGRLIDLHLLRSPDLHPPIARLEVQEAELEEFPTGDHSRFEESERRVVLRPGLVLEGVEGPVWELKVGGWQVLQRWIEARSHRPLSHEEGRTLSRLVTALARALALEERLDALEREVEEGGVAW